MSVRWLDGFELYDPNNPAERKYQVDGPTSLRNGRISGKCVRLLGRHFSTPPLKKTDFLSVGFSLRHTMTTPFNLIELRNSQMVQIFIHLDPNTQVISVYVGPKLMAVANVSLPQYEWHFVEFRALIHRNLGQMEMRIDNQSVFLSTHTNTLAGTRCELDRVAFTRPDVDNTQYIEIDDLYICDKATHPSELFNYSSFLGDPKVHATPKGPVANSIRLEGKEVQLEKRFISTRRFDQHDWANELTYMPQ